MSGTAVLERAAVVRRGRRLEYFTIAWNALEGLVAVVAGAAAGSFPLSALESIASSKSRRVRSCSVECPLTRRFMSANETRNVQLTPGIILACVSLVVMPLLSRAKQRVGRALGCSAMQADAKQTEFCTYLSAILLARLLLNTFFGLWWADPVAGPAMVPIIAKEGVGEGRAVSETV